MQEHQMDLSEIKESISNLVAQTIALDNLSKNISKSAEATYGKTADIDETIGDIKVIIRGVSGNIEKVQESLAGFYDLVRENSKPLDPSIIIEDIQREIGDNFTDLRAYLTDIVEQVNHVDIAKERDEARQMLAREFAQKLDPLDFSPIRNKASDDIQTKISAMKDNAQKNSQDVAQFVKKIRDESPLFFRWIFPGSYQNREALLSEIDAFVSSIAQEDHYQELLDEVSGHVTDVDSLSNEFKAISSWVASIDLEDEAQESEEDMFSAFGDTPISGNGATDDTYDDAYYQEPRTTSTSSEFTFPSLSTNGASPYNDMLREALYSPSENKYSNESEPEEEVETWL